MIANLAQTEVQAEVLECGELLEAEQEVGGKMPAPRLPPCERDFEVYEAVAVSGASTREAAREFGLSQTRIVQIRDRVAEWIAGQAIPLEKFTPRQRLRVGADLANRRMDHLYSQAMGRWRASQEEQLGDGRFLMWAARIVERQVKIGGVVEKTAAGVEARSQESEVRGQESGDKSEKTVEAASHDSLPPTVPPVGACSLSKDKSPAVQMQSSPQTTATAAAAAISDERKRQSRAFFGSTEARTEDCSATPKTVMQEKPPRRSSQAEPESTK